MDIDFRHHLRLTTKFERLTVFADESELGQMETPNEKAAQIRALELKMAALVEERQEIQKKCDSEPDPKKRALYWTKLAAIDNAIHNFKNDIFKRKGD